MQFFHTFFTYYKANTNIISLQYTQLQRTLIHLHTQIITNRSNGQLIKIIYIMK